MVEEFKGIAASPGIAIGRAHLFTKEKRKIVRKEISSKLVESEIRRFNQSLEKAREYLKDLIDRVRREVGEKEAEIYEAHLMMLDDESSFIKPVEEMIAKERVCAEYAVEKVLEKVISLFRSMESEYMRERAMDIKDVKELVISFLIDRETKREELSMKSVVVAEELLPSDIATLNKRMVLAFVTDKGGPTSHVAIVARTLKIPAVVGTGDFSTRIRGGELLIVDGDKGLVLLNPTEDVISSYRRLREKKEAVLDELMRETKFPAITVDGVRFKVFANVGSLEEVREAIRYGAEGIGLLRTEFMYINRESMPTEEELLEVFLSIGKLMKDRPIIVRTLDIGCDKPLPYVRMPEEANPFLGWRGIRLTLDNPRMMKTQLKALLRAGAYGNFKLMFPMITTVEEIRKAKELIMNAIDELKSGGIQFGEVEVGTMIETPASALIVDLLADEVDFFSIGTNDLTQYIMAADRGNARVSKFYNPLHPAVLRMIHKIIEEAHNAGREVGMCGEMASDPRAIPLLVGMGLDELSMNPSSIPKAKKVIRSISKKEAENLVTDVLSSKTLSEVLDLIAKFNKSEV